MERTNFLKMFAASTFTPFTANPSKENLSGSYRQIEAVRVFDTMAEFKKAAVSDFAPNDYVQVLGYHQPGDGGGGLFFWDAEGSADTNRGTIFKPRYSSFNGIGRWKRVKNERLNVKEFGAVGDGSTDDSPAIQNAVNALDLGMKLYFPEGTYRLKSNILLKKVDSISLVSNKAHLVARGEDPVRYMFDLVNCSNIAIKGFRFTGQPDKISVVRTEDVNSFIFAENYITECDNGVVARPGGESRDFKLFNNFGYDSNYAKISKQNQNINVLFYGFGSAKRWQVNNNTLLGGGHLTLGPASESWIVDGNTCINTSDSSIYLRGTNHTIVNNKIYNAGKDGIKTLITRGDKSSAAKQSIISNNFVKDSGQVVKTGGANINIDHGNSIISNNIVQLDDVKNLASNSTIGIIGMGKSSNITGNVITGMGNGNGIVFKSDGSNCDNTLISNNTIENIGTGVYVEQVAQYSCHNIKTDNNNIDNCEVGIKIESDNSSLFTAFTAANNSINRAGSVGFLCKGSAKKSIFENNNFFNLASEYAVKADKLDSDFIFRNNISDGSEDKEMFGKTSARLINNISGGSTVVARNGGINEQLIIANNDCHSVNPSDKNGIISINAGGGALNSIILSYDFEDQKNDVAAISAQSNIRLLPEALSGKTGESGEISIGYKNSELFIENRSGTEKRISYRQLNSL